MGNVPVWEASMETQSSLSALPAGRRLLAVNTFLLASQLLILFIWGFLPFGLICTEHEYPPSSFVILTHGGEKESWVAGLWILEPGVG